MTDKPQPLSGTAQSAPDKCLHDEGRIAHLKLFFCDKCGVCLSCTRTHCAWGCASHWWDTETTAAPVAVPANFVSDYSLPSCHVCGEMMKGVCPKCGTTTGVVVPAGPSDTLYVVEHKRDGQWRVHQGMNICMTRSFLEHIIIPELTKEFPNHEWRISEYLRSSK